MTYRRVGLILSLLALSACTKLFRTNEPLVDNVAFQIAPTATCMVLLPAPSLSEEQGTMLGTANSGFERSDKPKFKTVGAMGALKKLVEQPPVEDKRPATVFGQVTAEKCHFKVSRPIYSANFAFGEYASPYGEIGIYASKKEDGNWSDAENLPLGYW